ncbi:hypothetical protein Dimus_001173 [Dionaea muscipula]
MWLKFIRKAKPYVDPDLDPVLLVPGVAGSMLHAVDESGRSERVWVRVLGADYKLRTKLWSRFDPSSGKTVSLDTKTSIMVPEDRYGLCAIDMLDPDLVDLPLLLNAILLVTEIFSALYIFSNMVNIIKAVHRKGPTNGQGWTTPSNQRVSSYRGIKSSLNLKSPWQWLIKHKKRGDQQHGAQPWLSVKT